MPASDDPIVIEPVAAPLSHGTRAKTGRAGVARHWPKWATARSAWFGIAMALLGGLGALVFLVLPDRIKAPQPVLDALPPAAGLARTTSDEQIVPPFRALELQRAQRQAQDKLNEFVDLQLTLEQELHIAAWGAADLARVTDLANAGDQLFLEGGYDAALEQYAAAVDGLRALERQGNDLFEAAIAAGKAALDERDHASAVASFERAADIRPQHPDVLAGAERAAKLPQVAALLRDGRRASLRGDFEAAYDLLARVRTLDPHTAGLPTMLAEATAKRAAERRKTTLSRGFAALENGDHDTALAAFDAVLRGDPDDAVAQAGRQQTEQAQVLATIDRLRKSAEAQLQAEDWRAALASYEQALTIDPSLQFARDGRESVRTRMQLIATMERIVRDPALLSSNDEFVAAEATLREAEQQAAAGGKFAGRLERFRDIVRRGAVPVALVLVSDNATEVTIQKIGPVGTFDRTQLTLRPGRYVIVGSQDGCRDVRKEIVLASDTAPVDIRCAERI